MLDRSIAGCFALAALLHVGIGARGFLVAGVVAILVELAAIDLERRILPNRIVLPTLLVVLASQLALDPSFYVTTLVSAVGAALFLLIPSLIRRGAVGMGDVKLAALLGAALGPLVVSALALGLTAAGVYALLLVMTHSRTVLKQEIPLGPFLAAGAILAVLLT
jgi:prepilin signal peptidase PulO-like enzyme (type II secretory pathway)